MIRVEDAEQILNEISVEPGIEEVPIMESLNRVLAKDIVSSIEMPPFDKSAMDGYAFSSQDGSSRFKIVETIAAGDIAKSRIKKGECAKIMTGAALPHGADRVIRREITQEQDGYMQILEQDSAANVCYRGEDLRIGDVVLQAGVLLRAQQIGMIASLGRATVQVFRKPRVGVLTTGSEVVEPGKELGQGQIYNSNTYSLSAQLLQSGMRVEYTGIVPDDRDEIKKRIAALFDKCEMVIISGGVSMGDYDYVPTILEELGVKLYFEKLAIKPGKPTVFGMKEKKYFFGLPGNPVSTFVVFEIFVKPFLYRMMGHDYKPPIIKGVMKQDFKRKQGERTLFIPVGYRNGFVEMLEYHGSAHIYAFAQAAGLLRIPAGVKEILKGSTVDVRQV